MMFSEASIYIVLCFLLCGRISAQQVDEKQIIAEVCRDVNPTTDLDLTAEFQFEPQFKVHVESVMNDYGQIVNGWMKYSKSKKMMTTTLKSKTWNYAIYHDYNYHQTLVYNMADATAKRGSCLVDPDMKERLGFYLVPIPPAEGTAPEVTDILRITGPSGIGGKDIALQKETNPAKFRSLATNRYLSCQKITIGADAEAVVVVEHVMSNTKLARSETGTVPVQIVFDGQYVKGTDAKGEDLTGKRIKHTYNFFHYATSVNDDDFETPEGIVCRNRKGPSTFPDPPMYVSFGQEIHESDSSVVTTVKTTYDREFNFVAEEIFNPQPGQENIYRFDEFYFGYSYIVDRRSNICNYTEITKAGLNMNDYVVDQDGHITIQTPQQFWDDNNIEYHYNGKKHFRGLETEAWIGEDQSGVMYEWYFVFLDEESTSGKTNTQRIPYKRIYWPYKDDPKYFSTYYFQVDFSEPALILDLSPCYANEIKTVALKVDGLIMDVVDKDETTVVRKAVKKLSDVLGVHWTRISRPSISFRGDVGYFVFDLLPVPPQSSDVLARKEPSLEEAYKTLNDLTKSRKLAFDVGNREEFIEGLAFIENLKYEPPSRPGGGSGYSAGAMAGLCIAMAVIGLGAGGAGGYWFFIRS